MPLFDDRQDYPWVVSKDRNLKAICKICNKPIGYEEMFRYIPERYEHYECVEKEAKWD